MDESTIEKLSQVKIVEPDNQTKFRKKGSNAIKMTGPTFLQFLYNKKGGFFNRRISGYNSVREKMKEVAAEVEVDPEEANISKYYALEEKLANIGAKILWAEEKENFVKRSAKKLKVPSILIMAIAPVRNFFNKKKYMKIYKKKMELLGDDALKKVKEEGIKSFNIPMGEELSISTLSGQNKQVDSSKQIPSNVTEEDNNDQKAEKKPLSLKDVLANANQEPTDKPLSDDMKTEDDIKKHLEFYCKKISSYSDEEYKKIIENIEQSAKDINFELNDYMKLNFKDYVKDFILNVDAKNPTEEDIKTFTRYDEIANRYHIDFAKTREEIYKDEEARLLKLKEEQEAQSKVKGQINPSEVKPVNKEGQTMKYQPFDWSKYQKKDDVKQETKDTAPTDDNKSDNGVDQQDQQNVPKFQPVDDSKSDNGVDQQNQQNTSSSKDASSSNNNNNNSNINVDNLYKEYNPDITYDYNYGVINDDLRNLTEEELKREEKRINEAFLSYVLIKHGKGPRELLSNIQEYIEITNDQRMEHNRELNKNELPLLANVEEIPQDYYLHSIYSNEFFKDNPDQFERTQKLANEVMRRIEEKEKEKQARIAALKEQERIKTGRLVLKYGIGGYYADPNTNLTDKEVLDMVKLLETQNLYKDAKKRAGIKVREIKQARIQEQQAQNTAQGYYFINEDNIKVR
jgi:nucleolar protein nop52, putative